MCTGTETTEFQQHPYRFSSSSRLLKPQDRIYKERLLLHKSKEQRCRWHNKHPRKRWITLGDPNDARAILATEGFAVLATRRRHRRLIMTYVTTIGNL